MHRRDFVRLAGLGSLGLIAARPGHSLETKRRLAVTIDDPTTKETPLMSVEERDRAMLTALGEIRAALFVCGMRVDSLEGSALLDRWSERGHRLGNHSYSHLYYHSSRIDVASYIADVEKGEKLIERRRGFERLFRFPYLKEGNTAEKRDAMRSFLRDRECRNGYVTIDASDWYFDARLQKRLAADPKADITPYREAYLAHIRDRASYYDGLAVTVLGRTIPHTLLLHHSLLNALFLGDLIAMFRADGWEIIDADSAYADPVFGEQPDILPAGESLVWSLAKQTGRFDDLLRYPAEDGEYEKEALDANGL